MHSTVSEVITALEKTSSKLEKAKILEENKDLPGLKEFFVAALDPFETYYIKKIPQYGNTSYSISLFDGMSRLKQFSSRKLTGGAAIQELTYILENMQEENANLIERIIQKDPKCGVQTQVNKIWPKLIKEYPVLLCSAYDEKLIGKLNWKAGVIVNLKSDGARCNIIISDVGVEVFTRQGRIIDVKGQFDYLFDEGFRNVVIDGELLVRDSSGKPMSRKEGNGIVNKAIKGTISEADAKNLYLMAWDLIPLEDFKNEYSAFPYIARVKELEKYINGHQISIIPADIAHSFEEAMEICQRYYDAGEEGAILKDQDMTWSSTRSKKAIKLKLELDCDLEVFDYQEGTGKLEGLMGALLCRSSDKKVIVSVGGGYSLKQRAQIAANYKNIPITFETISNGIATQHVVKPSGEKVVGQILATIYNAKISCDGVWSLFLPRAATGDFRLDKSVADSFDEIK